MGEDLNAKLEEVLQELRRLNERRFPVEIGKIEVGEEMLRKHAELLGRDVERCFNEFKTWLVNRMVYDLEKELERYLEYVARNEILPSLKKEYMKILGDVRALKSKVEEMSAVFVESGEWNVEDRHLYPVIKWIEKTHRIERTKVILHGRLNVEFDALIFGKTEGDQPRVIGVEFKENDMWKLTEQAIARKPFVHYQYAVINRSPFYIMEYYMREFQRLVSEGVGVISIVETEERPLIVPLRKARYNPKVPDDVKRAWEGVMNEGWRVKDAQRLREYRTLSAWMKGG